MKLLCQIWFWFDIVAIILTLLIMAYHDGYPRERPLITRADDVRKIIGCAFFAGYLYYAIWVRGTL
jgi:hypothetical protein